MFSQPGAVGGRYGGLVELLDLFPTFCDAAGIEPPTEVAGRSLWADAPSGRDAGSRAVFSESYPMQRNHGVMGDRPHRMIHTKRWKLIQYGDMCVDLFDVVEDSENNQDLAGDRGYESVKRQLLQELEATLGPLPAAATFTEV